MDFRFSRFKRIKNCEKMAVEAISRKMSYKYSMKVSNYSVSEMNKNAEEVESL